MRKVRCATRTFLGWQGGADDVQRAAALPRPPALARRAPGPLSCVMPIGTWLEEEPFAVTIVRRPRWRIGESLQRGMIGELERRMKRYRPQRRVEDAAVLHFARWFAAFHRPPASI